MPTRMKPITGLIRKRAKVGITIPAAPRITSASLSPEVPNSLVIGSLGRKPGESTRGGRNLGPAGPQPALVQEEQGGYSPPMADEEPDLLIAGGGPAGMMAGLL